jgi:hypothetical protein
MNAISKIQPSKNNNPDLQLAFDVGHSSIGWAVLQSRTGVTPVSDVTLLGCGVVTFPADDCLAIDRRNKRRQRRNIRSRRQRIERMEKLLAHLEVIPETELKRLHLQAKGHSKQTPHERRGASFPWLLAARVLAAQTEDEKRNSLLTWPELWDVLRWYAHNRGYDENLRWSGDYTIEGYSPENRLQPEVLGKMAEQAKKREQSGNGDGNEKPKKKEDVEENDSDKLAMGCWLMREYGFQTPTFAESFAKFLLGPERAVKPPKLPGGVGQPEKTKEVFTEEEFRHKLFGLSEEYRNHPKHLRNYYKGLKAAFPRRYLITGTKILAGGTEWEVRTIIRAHFNSPEGKARCDETFERVICGGIPEKRDDWKAYENQFPHLYLSDTDREKLKGEYKIRRRRPDECLDTYKKEKKRIVEERKKFLTGKIVLPKRYQGGLLFGQLVPRFENRIIAECLVTYGRKLPMLLRVIAGETPYTDAELWPDETKTDKKDKKKQIDREITHFQKKLSKLPVAATKEDKEKLAKHFAADLAKVPGKNCLAFLDYRWAMLLANIKIRKLGDIFPKGETLRPLKASERQQIDARAREKGFLIYERKEGKRKKGKNANTDNSAKKETKKPEFTEINEMAEIVQAVTGCGIEETNLDGFFIPPDMREALKIVPAEKGGEAFRLVWRHLDEKLRRRFAIRLLKGKVFTPEIICSELRKLERPEMAAAIEADAKAKLMTTEFACKKLEGRARYHHNVLRQAWREVMRGEDPRKKISDEIFLPKPKERDGCLVISNGTQRLLDEKPLASESNNHLVRQRIQVLTGNMQVHRDGTLRRNKDGRIVPRNSLLDDIINAPEFANGDERRINRITIEVTRDLQEMSGKGNEEKKKIEGQKRAEHTDISNKLAKWLVDEKGERLKINGQPVKIGKYIKKAWIAEDLADRGAANEAWRWRCPYTVPCGNNPIFLEPKHLVYPLSNDSRLELEHIIPKSKRVANGMEAQVLTLRAVNQMKGQRSGLQFIKERGGRPVPGLPGRRVMTEAEYRAFVDALPTKGATKQDIQRRKKRKELLLTEHWNEQEFVPRDLTNTAYVVKLAAEKLRARFRHLGENAPPVVYVPSSVTSAFRDKSWRMFRELAAAHPEVKAEMEKGDERFRFGFDGGSPKERNETRKQILVLSTGLKKFFETFGKESFTEAEKDAKTKELDALFQDCGQLEVRKKVFWLKSSFNLKQAIREITQLHHAVDAATLGLVTYYLVPPQCGSLDGTLAKYIVKGSLNNTERDEFRRIYYSLQLARNFWFQRERRLRFVGKDYEEQQDNRETFIAKCGEELRELIDKDAREPLTADERARFEKLVDELDLPRLFYFDTKNRVHIRDLRSGIKKQLHGELAKAIKGRIVQHVPADMSVMSVKENIKGYEVLDEKWAKVYQQERDSNTGKPKRKKPQKIARDKLIGVGAKAGKLAAVKGVLEITENMAVAMAEQNADNEEPPPMLVIPLHAARKRLEKFRDANRGKRVMLIRKGSLIRFKSGLHSGTAWKVFGVDNDQKNGPLLKIAKPDVVSLQTEPELNYKVTGLRTRWRDVELIEPPFTGIATYPTTSPA